MLYDHVSALTRVFGFGNGLEGERDRIRESMKPTFCGVTAIDGKANLVIKRLFRRVEPGF